MSQHLFHHSVTFSHRRAALPLPRRRDGGDFQSSIAEHLPEPLHRQSLTFRLLVYGSSGYAARSARQIEHGGPAKTLRRASASAQCAADSMHDGVTVPRKKGRFTRNAELTRQRLRAAAIKLFAERGFNDVSIHQIVALAGVDKALVYHYYGGKEGLYAAALQEVYRRPDTVEERALESGSTTREKLTNLLEAMSKFLEQNPDYVRMLFWENLGRGKHLRHHDHLLGKSFFPRFQEIIRHGIEAGELRRDIVPQHLFINFIGLIFIYHSNRRSFARELRLNLDDAGVRAEGLRQITRLVFAGIRQA